MTSSLPAPLAALVRVARALEELDLDYHVGGSFASSIHGIPRESHDADLVVDLPPALVPALVARLATEFFADEPTIRAAVATGRSFNLVHFETGFKVDVFPRGPGPFDRTEAARLRRERVSEDPPIELPIKSPEDTVLRKLEWYRLGGEVSDRQWSDVLGVLRVQGERLDVSYLERWAGELGVTDLLARALSER